MKNYADLGGFYPPQPSASADNTLLDLHNSSYHTQPHPIIAKYLTHTVRVNTKIIDSDVNWNLLLYKEAYHIKRSAPSLNNGLKASRELCLFS